jgi:HK97 family phage major capsid protein
MNRSLTLPGGYATAQSDTIKRAARISGHFMKALNGDESSRLLLAKDGFTLTRALNEGADSAGGFLVPTSFDDSVLAILETVGAARAGGIEIRQTDSGGSFRPRRTTTGLSAAFVSEGQVIPSSTLLLDAVEFAPKRRAILTSVSSELFEDSAVEIGTLVSQAVAYAFAALEDDCVFNGDGTSVPFGGTEGVSKKPVSGMKGYVQAASSHHTFLTLDATDLSNLMAGVMAAAIPGAAWFCSNQFYSQTICRLSVSSGGLVMSPNGRPSFLGHDVYMSSKLPNGLVADYTGLPMCYFGDISMAATICERRQTTIALSRQQGLDADITKLRATQRQDIVVHDVGSTTAAGPIAVLTGA